MGKSAWKQRAFLLYRTTSSMLLCHSWGAVSWGAPNGIPEVIGFARVMAFLSVCTVRNCLSQMNGPWTHKMDGVLLVSLQYQGLVQQKSCRESRIVNVMLRRGCPRGSSHCHEYFCCPFNCNAGAYCF